MGSTRAINNALSQAQQATFNANVAACINFQGDINKQVMSQTNTIDLTIVLKLYKSLLQVFHSILYAMKQCIGLHEEASGEDKSAYETFFSQLCAHMETCKKIYEGPPKFEQLKDGYLLREEFKAKVKSLTVQCFSSYVSTPVFRKHREYTLREKVFNAFTLGFYYLWKELFTLLSPGSTHAVRTLGTVCSNVEDIRFALGVKANIIGDFKHANYITHAATKRALEDNLSSGAQSTPFLNNLSREVAILAQSIDPQCLPAEGTV